MRYVYNSFIVPREMVARLAILFASSKYLWSSIFEVLRTYLILIFYFEVEDKTKY